jgi:hypothetical protein
MNVGISTWTIRNELEYYSLVDAIRTLQSRFGDVPLECCMSHFGKEKNIEIFNSFNIKSIIGSIKNKKSVVNISNSSSIAVKIAKEWIDFACLILGRLKMTLLA